jgi:multidrug efflux pump subunit AcrB
LTSPYEKALTTLVDNVQHIESTTYNGEAIVKVFLQPGASLDTANAQVTAAIAVHVAPASARNLASADHQFFGFERAYSAARNFR